MTKSNMQVAGAMLALAMAAPAAQAQYRCTDGGGRVSYQQLPCMPGQQGSGKPLAAVAPAAPESAAPRPASPYAADIARFAREDKVKAAIAEKRLFVGMTPSEVVASWGAPVQKNRFSGEQTVDQWVYGQGSATRYVEFSEGRVSAIQEYNVRK